MIDRRRMLAGMAGAGMMAGLGRAALAEPEQSFAAWLGGVRADAAKAGVLGPVLDRALGNVRQVDRVLELDQHQPEQTITFRQYLDHIVSPQRVSLGRRRFAEHRALLERIAERYHVQARFIVALWGIESDYGAVMGEFSTLNALATLGYGSSRPDLFRGELIAALQLLQKTGFAPRDLKGSWAGAMGQTQFMPSSYLRYAVAEDGSESADIWENHADVFASIANYLAREGWNGSATWGRPVSVPARLDRDLAGGKVVKPVAAWVPYGVRLADGGPLPDAAQAAALVVPAGDGPALLAYDNFRVIMKWNHSTYFAAAVGFLADQLAT